MSESSFTQSKLRKEDLLVKDQGSATEHLSNIVGPAYIMCGLGGSAFGLVKSLRDVAGLNRPTRLILASTLNGAGRQANKYANAGAGIAMLYTLSKTFIEFAFKEELEGLSSVQKSAIIGFSSGAIFKCSRGFLPSMLAGSLMCAFGSSLTYLKENGYTKYSL